VKLGVRKASAHEKPKLRITVSEPWEIPPTPGWDKPRARGEALRTADTEIGIAVADEAKGKPTPPTRPYLYDVGQGVLMLSVAQGPDAIYEPYGVLKSTDVGKLGNLSPTSSSRPSRRCRTSAWPTATSSASRAGM